MADFDGAELTSEKTFFQIYRKERTIPHTWFNWIAVLVLSLLLTLQEVVSEVPYGDKIDGVRNFAEKALIFGVSTLGLLLAGFTIFATLSQPQMLLAMAKMKKKGSQLSYLKFNYLVFMRVMTVYLVYSVTCLLMLAFCNNGGLVESLAELSAHPDLTKSALVSIAIIYLYSGFFYLLLQLKSFIFNIYQAVMTALRWEHENPTLPKS